MAKLAASVIALVTPGGMGRVFLKYWLQLLGLMAVLMVITGWLAQKTEVERVGLFVLFGVFLAGWLASVLEDRLKKAISGTRLPGDYLRVVIRAIKWLPALILAILVLIGCRHFLGDSRLLYERFRGLLGFLWAKHCYSK